MITLAKTAQLCSKQPSDLASIEDPSIALAFNVECAEVLFEAELEREKRYYEAMGIGVVSTALGGQVPSESPHKVDRW